VSTLRERALQPEARLIDDPEMLRAVNELATSLF